MAREGARAVAHDSRVVGMSAITSDKSLPSKLGRGVRAGIAFATPHPAVPAAEATRRGWCRLRTACSLTY